jgi:hypothetical protein
MTGWRRTGVQWGLLALVIGGLAGAVWLPTGAAGREPGLLCPRLTGAIHRVALEQPGALRLTAGPADFQHPATDVVIRRHDNGPPTIPSGTVLRTSG